MTIRKSMNAILLFAVVFFGLFPSTISLFCSIKCSMIQVKYSESFIEPSDHPSCTNDTSTQICKGRIIASYNGKHYPKYINYTFGTIDDFSEKQYENSVTTHVLATLTKYRVIINASSQETTIISDIYCTTDHECALMEIRKLFYKYNHQFNPYYQVKSFLYSDSPSKTLSCYDISDNKRKKCESTNSSTHPVCIAYLSQLKQECSLETNLEVHEEFILTSPSVVQLSLTTDLVQCNKDNCNEDEVLAKIQRISRDYAYGTIIMDNHAQRQRMDNYQIFLYSCFHVFLLLTY